jgi:hypothetical protein
MARLRAAGRALILLAALAASTATATVHKDRRGKNVVAQRSVATNAAGQPVLTKDGALKRYQRSEWKAALPPMAHGAGPPATHAPANGPAIANWSYTALGSGIGLTGLSAALNTGRPEIYAAGGIATFGGNEYWYALRYAPQTHSFQQVYASERYSVGIRRVALAHLAGQGWVIVVALGDGTVYLYDQPTKVLLSTFAGPCTARGGLQSLIAADLSGDGADEFVSSCADGSLVAHGAGYTTWTLAGAGGTDLVAGQMDGDPAIEIASTTGDVVDAFTHATQWHRQGGFGAHLEAADIDADGRDELIAADPWYIVWAYDVDRQLPRWSISSDLDIGAIRVGDVDGDGAQELLLGDGQWGAVHAYDTTTLAEEWSIDNPEHGVTNIAMADVDLDGVLDVLWGAGATSSGPDHLYVADWQTREIQAQTESLDGPFVGPQVGDLDGDGINEIVAASSSSDSTYASGRIVVFDSRTHAVRAISPGVADGIYAWTGIHDLKLRDLDGDGRPEILVATDHLYDGLIEAYSFSASNKFTRVWSNATRPVGAPFHSVDVADIDGDGDLEVLGGGGREHTGAQGVYIYAYDVRTHAEQWHTLQLGDYWSSVTDLAVADTDGDGDLDVAGMVEGGDVYVFDGASHVLDAIVPVEGASFGILKTGGAPQLMVGSASGHLVRYAFDGTGYAEISDHALQPTALDGLRVLAPGSLWVGSNGFLTRYDHGAKSFQTANYGIGFGSDVAATMRARHWVFSAGSYGVHGFTTKP